MLMRLDYKKKINDMQNEITLERNERERTYNKYNKIHVDTTLSIVETIAVSGAAAAGSIGIASIASVVVAPVGFTLEGVCHWFRRCGDSDEIR